MKQEVLRELRLHFYSVTLKMISKWFNNWDSGLHLMKTGTFCTEVKTCTTAITFDAGLKSYFPRNKWDTLLRQVQNLEVTLKEKLLVPKKATSCATRNHSHQLNQRGKATLPFRSLCMHEGISTALVTPEFLFLSSEHYVYPRYEHT